jgi:hypothetical protein
MGAALHPGVSAAGASFELERVEVDDGRLVVRGWWSGLRGVRFVRPALVVDGRQVLATLEHKPWSAREDVAWIAAFPWRKTGTPELGGVTLAVAPSVEVPLDRDAARVLRAVSAAWPATAEVVPATTAPAAPCATAEVAAVAPSEVAAAPAGPPAAAAAVPRARDVSTPLLREELGAVERRLDGVHAELREARALAAERDARCRELEHVVARERRAAHDAEGIGDDAVRSHAMATLDRDRALAQQAEAVGDREAAVRARTRIEAQRDEAVALREAADARREEALAERDAARAQRDELALVHQTLRAQLRHGWAQDDATPAAPREGDTETRRDRSAETRRDGSAERQRRGDRERRRISDRARRRDGQPDTLGDADLDALRDRQSEAPIGVRTIPAARMIAAHLHRSQRVREHGFNEFDVWAARILGSVAAVSFIALIGMLLKAFFVF